ncbi:MAG TPA: CDP-glycerol glycerophosphotransferase family protein [Clostridiales bacterium]|nr:CDP-glycerol glycerophosphotransferase family protein [Clostridiales bacterium]HQP69013.1 CDP-glycerol glycerophosphotransferase family protein [Clostridiales bacterium]
MKYLFYISKFYSIPIIQPLMDYLDHSKANDYVIMVSRKVNQRLKDENIWQNKLVITTIEEGKDFNPDFCLSPGNYVDFRLPGIKVEIFHGIGIEKESHYEIRHFFDVYCTSGPVVTERFNVLQKKYGYFLVRETGWPKMDHILSYPHSNIREKFNYPIYKKIVLYAPTFSEKLQSGDDILPVIPQIINSDEIWLIKFHEFMNKQAVENIKNSNNDNIQIIDTYDITPYLYIADVMISDTSSVIYEFMALDKPVITYRTAARKDKGIDILNPEELRPALNKALKNPEDHSERRKKHLFEVNPYLNGKIAERVFSVLESIRNNNELPNMKKPLNLFRKLRILYHEKFRKGYLK